MIVWLNVDLSSTINSTASNYLTDRLLYIESNRKILLKRSIFVIYGVNKKTSVNVELEWPFHRRVTCKSHGDREQ